MKSSYLRARIFRILRVTLDRPRAHRRGRRGCGAVSPRVDSEQAVINAEIMQIRTPINGVLEIGRRPSRHASGKRRDASSRCRIRGSAIAKVSRNTTRCKILVETVESELIGRAASSVELAEVAAARTQRLHKAQLIARVEMEQDPEESCDRRARRRREDGTTRAERASAPARWKSRWRCRRSRS